MDDIYLMTVFVAVGEELSFAGASRRLDAAPALVKKAVDCLEDKRGARFLHRGARKLQLTEAGSRYLHDARAILELIKAAEDNAIGAGAASRGPLRVTAPTAFGRLYIVPCIAEYLQRYPGMEVSAMFADRSADLMDEGFDVAVQIGQLTDSRMKAVHVGRSSRCAYAAPAYLAKYGVPDHPADLKHHRVIGTEMSSTGVVWEFEARNAPLPVHLKPVLNAANDADAVDAAVLGIGIAQLHSYHAMDAVSKGQLRPILKDYVGEPLPIHLLHSRRKFGESETSSFIDMIVERLSTECQFK